MPSPSRAGPEPTPPRQLRTAAPALQPQASTQAPGTGATGSRVFYHPFLPRIFFKGDTSWGAVWFQSRHPLGRQPAGARDSPGGSGLSSVPLLEVTRFVLHLSYLSVSLAPGHLLRDEGAGVVSW